MVHIASYTQSLVESVSIIKSYYSFQILREGLQ